MAKSTARTWALFKVIRAMVYTLAIITCLGLGIIYGILTAYGWDAYHLYQRAIVVLLLTVYTISAITFYFMLILRFRLILDGIRLGLLFLLQVGGTVTFAFITDSLPCVKIARPTCKLMENVAVLGGYSLAGLMLVFSFYLIGMHYVPVPTRRMHPEALLALQLSQSQKTVQPDEKRDLKRQLSVLSAGSDHSVYSQKSYRSQVTPYTYALPSEGRMDKNHSPSSSEGSVNYPMMPMDAMRSQTPGSHYRPITPGSMHSGEISSEYASQPQTRQVLPPFEHYRSPTPAGSVRSVALTSASSIRTVPRQRYNNNNGIPAPQPRMAPTASYPMLVTPLTHAFSEPVSRHGTPMTALSNTSFYMPPTPMQAQSQRRQQRALLSPPGLATVGEGMAFPRPPATVYSRSGSPNTSPKYGTTTLPMPGPYEYSEHAQRLRQSPPPGSVSVQLQEAQRMRTPSPYARQPPPLQTEEDRFRSRTPIRAPSVSSIPRSPSLENVPFTESLPSTPRAGILPARPGMNAAAYNGRFGSMSPEMGSTHRERYGSDASTDSLSLSVRSGHSRLTNERVRFESYPNVTVNGTPVPTSDAQYYRQAQSFNGMNDRAGDNMAASNRYPKPAQASPSTVARHDWIAQDASGEIELWRKDMERRYNRTPAGGL